MTQAYGLLAEFSNHEELLRAAEKAHAAGFRKMDAFAPFPVDGLPEALGKKTRLPLIVLIGGIIGGVGAYYMEWYANAVSYVINIGGRPIHSWPAFIPITFELTVLAAGLTAFFFSLGLSRLPSRHDESTQSQSPFGKRFFLKWSQCPATTGAHRSPRRCSGGYSVLYRANEWNLCDSAACKIDPRCDESWSRTFRVHLR